MKNHNFKNLKGKTFGFLTCISIDETKTTKKHTYWLCRCVCGNERSLQTSQLTSNRVTSCGCKNTGRIKIPKDQKRLYSVYGGMLARCYNPSNISYKYYGAKGITVCDEWKNSFFSFAKWSINNNYNDSLSIDRINNSLGYCPSNCRWVTMQEQLANKSNVVLYTHNGETHNLKEWCELLNYSYQKAKDRRKYLKKIGRELSFDNVFYSVL